MPAQPATLPRIGRPATRHRIRHFLGVDLKVLLVLACILVIIRALLPYAVREYVNRTLDRIPEYDGHVMDVDLALWRGAYSIQGVEIVKTTGKVPVPLFKSPRVDFSVEWPALWDGAVVGEVAFYEPEVNIVAAKSAANSQTGVGKEWQTQIQKLFPLRINRFEIFDGAVHFRNFQRSPDVDLFLRDLHVLATNLTNSRDLSDTMWAHAEVEGASLGGGKLVSTVDVNPYAARPTFDMDTRLTGVDLKALNPFFKAYGNFDVQGGSLDLFTEVASRDGRFQGYLKPMFRKLDVFDLDEKHESILQAFWEAVLGTTGEVLQNQEKEHLSARIPIAGETEDPSAGVVDAIVSVLRNAFVRALLPKIDRTISMEDAPTTLEQVREITDQDVLDLLGVGKKDGGKKKSATDAPDRGEDPATGADVKEEPPPKILR